MKKKRDRNEILAPLAQEYLSRQANSALSSADRMSEAYNSRFFDANGNEKNGFLPGSEQYLKSTAKQYYDIKKAATNLAYNMSRFGSYYDDEYNASMQAAIDNLNQNKGNFGSIYNAARASRDFYSQFKTENDYNAYMTEARKAQAKQEQADKLKKMSDAELDRTISDVNRTIQQYKNGGAISNNALAWLREVVFGIIDSKNGTDYHTAGSDKRESDRKLLQEAERKLNELMQEKQSRSDAALLERIKRAGAERKFDELHQYASEINSSNFFDEASHTPKGATKGYTEPRKEAYEKLKTELLKRGFTEADIEQYGNIKANEASQKRQEKIAAAAGSNAAAGAALSLAGIVTSPMRGLTNIMGDAQKISGDYLPGATPGDLLTDLSKGATQGVTAGIEGRVNGGLGKVLSTLYQFTTSAAESGYMMLTAGPFTELLFSANAAADAYDEAQKRGLTEAQALTYASASGIFEALFEHLSIEKIKYFQASGKSTILNFLKSFISEGTEEVSTSLADEIADYLINGGLSAYETALAEGMTPQEYGLQFIQQLGLDFLGGGFGGLAMGGVQHGISLTAQSKNMGAANRDAGQALVRANALQTVIEQGRQSGQKKTVRNAEKLATLAAAEDIGKRGEKLAGGIYYALNSDHISNVIGETAKQIAADNNETVTDGQINEIATGVTALISGRNLTPEQFDALDTETGKKVMEDVRNSGSELSNLLMMDFILRSNIETHDKTEAQHAETTDEAEREAAPQRNAAAEQTEQTAQNARTVEQTAREAAEDAVLTPEEKEEIAEVENGETRKETAEAVLKRESGKYGQDAKTMRDAYEKGQDAEKYAVAFEDAYNIGYTLQPEKALKQAGYLTDGQRQTAYQAGVKAAERKALNIADKYGAANGKTGRRRGSVTGKGVTIADMKKAFNDQQGRAYKVLSAIADVTGIDIVLYASEADGEGNYQGAQGKFNWKDNAIYIDINAGLKNVNDVGSLGKYAMLRTFTHEFVHFIEKWNAKGYNDLRKTVFAYMTENRSEDGLTAHEMIQDVMDAQGISYDRASREVVAESLADILPDSRFVETLAEKHRTVFEKLRDMLKEFAQNVKDYFANLGWTRYAGARLLKTEKDGITGYIDGIVKVFDSVAEGAVETYQMAFAVDETTGETVVEAQPVTEETTEETAAEEEPAVETETKAEEATQSAAETEKPKTRFPKYHEAKNAQAATEKTAEPTEAAEEQTAAPKGSQKQKTAQAAPVKENKQNGAENDRQTDRGTVRQPSGNGQRDSQLLEELQEEAVQGHGGQRGTVPVSDEGRRETGGNGDQSDAERNGSGGSAGSGESGVQRGHDVLSEPETLPEVVQQEKEQRSTEKPKGNNFVIGDSLELPSGEKSRYKANVEAIRLVKKLEAEGRYATPEEQVVLSKYVGWGGLANAFGEERYNYETHSRERAAKQGWEAEFAELKELLTEEEYNAASKSTLNAHYTDISVIKAMYRGLNRLGFDGGRMLEPSSGVGNFVGAMPADMTAKVKSWTMVELDNVTGLIAKYLYPNADVRIQGFQDANIPNNFMDVAISNVPFGDYAIPDKTYPARVTKAIHNYFFAKSLDKVRPGGIVMFITSSFTMNAKDSGVREYIMKRADLLGAIRLPQTAFKGNAGTEVVTDILVLKKRAPGTDYAGESFLEAPYQYFSGGAAYVNEYFTNHPEMVLGTPSFERGMYGRSTFTYKPLEGKGNLAQQIDEAFSHINGKMDYTATPTAERSNFDSARKAKHPKEGSLSVEGGKLYQKKEGETREVAADKTTVERVKGLLDIRDAYRTLAEYLQQGQAERLIKKARNDLNTAYDNFVKKHGYINTPANRKAIEGDPDRFSIYSLENYDNEKKTATKADIFTKDTIAPNRTVTHVDDVAAGVIVSVNKTGTIDAGLIANLTGKSIDAVTRELIDGRLAFKNKDGVLEPAETYLSGNVRAKLREAEALVPFDKDYQNNVDALREIQPQDIPYQDIYTVPGAVWVPTAVYADFIAYMLGGTNTVSYRGPDVEVSRSNQTGNFTIKLNNGRLKSGYRNTQQWGTKYRSFLNLFDAMLANRSVVVKDKLADGTFEINKVETAAANEKIEQITKEWQKWLWEDETRRSELASLYNETYNALVNPKYDGENLTVNGLNAGFALRSHQKSAVKRIVSSGGNTLLAHKVGAGKTLEMAAAAMKLKELGIVKKPMFIVPKSLVAQWGVEFKNYFPTARLMVADEKSFTPANRKVQANQIANNDYDGVIVSYEQFEKIPMSAEFQREFYQEQIDDIIASIAEEKAEKGKSLSVKDMEKRKAQLEAEIKKLTDKAKDEDNITFEQLGIDSIFVDEAHNFKNLMYTTRMTNVAGLGNKNGAKRSFDLYTKVRYLQKLNGGRGVVFATATPVMNSMSEMYIMQKYLQSDALNQLGLSTFDAWAKQFGEVVNQMEIKPSGQGFRVKQAFSKFRNLNELQLLFRSFSDVLTNIPGLKIPKMKGGKVHVVECESSAFQKNYMKELEKRAENIRNVDPRDDNMLKITSDGRKISYTQKMIDPSLPYEPGCKIMRCVDNVFDVWKNSKTFTDVDGKTQKNGTQLVFCDMATPKGRSATAKTEETEESTDAQSVQLYDDIKELLVKKGIPAKEIAFIHDAKTDQQKKKLFEDVNEGRVRVLIGSTGKMGVGMNAQRRITAIHHLDAPWRPGDVEQRNGRAYRQGNLNPEVECFTYVTVGSFDARLWDILDRKQSFINQIMNGEDVGRSAEDTGEVTLSAAEVKALASGNPMIMEQVQLQNDISKLEDLRRAHNSEVATAREKAAKDQTNIATVTSNIQNAQKDIKDRKDTYSDGKFKMTVGTATYTDKKDAGIALVEEVRTKAKEGKTVKIGSFAGFEITVLKKGPDVAGFITGSQSYPFNIYFERTTQMVNKIIDTVQNLPAQIEKWQHILAELKTDLAAQEKIVNSTFAKQDELDSKRARFNEVMAILNPKEEQALDEVDDEQEQSRSFLEGIDFDKLRAKVVSRFNLRGINDYIHVQKKVLEGLKKNHFFNSFNEHGSIARFSTVEDTGMRVEINQSGIRETLGPDKRYGKATAEKKILKLAVIEQLPEIIANAKQVDDDVKNRHDNASNKKYAYLEGQTYVDEIPVKVRIDVKKSPIKNKFWMHYVDVEQNMSATPDLPVAQSADPVIHSSSPTEAIVQQNADIVKEKFIEQNQQREEAMTDREILQIAREELQKTQLSPAERDGLAIIGRRLDKLEALQAERIELGQTYREQQFGKGGSRKEAAATLDRMHELDAQVREAENAVLKVENTDVLKSLLQKSRTVIEKQDAAKTREALRRYRDRRENAAAIKKYRDRIRKDTDSLKQWIIKPDNKNVIKHVPDALKQAVIPFLSSIDFTSKRQLKGGAATKADAAFTNGLEAIARALQTSVNAGDIEIGLPPEFTERLYNLAAAARLYVDSNSGEYVINRMTAAELKELSSVVRNLKAFITKYNRMHENLVFAHVTEAGDNSIGYMAELSNAKHTGTVTNRLLWEQMRPAYAFERFGEGGKSIWQELVNAEDKLAKTARKIIDFAEQTYTAKEVNAWTEEMHTFDFLEEKVQISTAYLMALYELWQQEDSRRHILKGGLRVATNSESGEKIMDNGHVMTEDVIEHMLAELTPRQKEVADKLQQYMQKEGGKLGNYVTMARFGEALFGIDHYFPINSDGRELPANADEKFKNADLYALLNMGFTKQRNDAANNRLIVYNIFDVFANHMASMAQYNAYALPLIDTLKWLNYRQTEEIEETGENGKTTKKKLELDTVRKQMARAYGTPEDVKGSGSAGYAEAFVTSLIRDINGTAPQGSEYDSLAMKELHRFNRAQVAFNARVVIQQPLAITRAAMLLDYGTLIRGLSFSPAQIKANIAEMQEHSGIALRKSLGFYDVNISRGLTELIKHSQTIPEKITEFGMKGAEIADNVTWAAIWNACKVQAKKKNHNLTEEQLMEATGNLFDEVIYKTQVVDSVLAKNQYLRSKSPTARVLGSFMNEPMTTASMVLDAFDKYNTDLKRGRSRSEAWRLNKKNIGRTLYVYAVSQILLSAVEAVADAWRDDDDEPFSRKLIDAFTDNVTEELLPFNKLPVISAVYDLAKSVLAALGFDTYGYGQNTIILQCGDYIVKAAKILHSKINSEKSGYTWYAELYKLLQAASGATGFAAAALTREIASFWNNTVGRFAPSLKLVQYRQAEAKPGTMTQAFYDGLLEKAKKGDLKGVKSDVNGIIDAKMQGDKNFKKLTDEGYVTVSEGVSREDAQKSAKSSLTTRLKETYLTAVGERDSATTALVRKIMAASGLYDDIDGTLEKWVEDARK
jgi:N12 class adenine-specific DNA methylase